MHSICSTPKPHSNGSQICPDRKQVGEKAPALLPFHYMILAGYIPCHVGPLALYTSKPQMQKFQFTHELGGGNRIYADIALPRHFCILFLPTGYRTVGVKQHSPSMTYDHETRHRPISSRNLPPFTVHHLRVQRPGGPAKQAEQTPCQRPGD